MQEASSRPSAAQLRLAGLLAGAVALAALWAASAVASGIAFPPASVAEIVIRAAPGGVATFFIELLQHWALRLLTLGVVVGALALAAEALVAVTADGPTRPYPAGAALALLGGLAVLTAPTGGVSIVATGAALALGAAAYGYTARRLATLLAAHADGPDAARRRALVVGVGGALGIALGGGVVGWLARRVAGPDTDVALAPPGAPASVPRRPSFPSIEGLSREVTPVPAHYVVDINLLPPVVEARGWSLSVGGDVEERLDLSFEALQNEFEVVEEYAVLACVSNEVGGDLVGHSLWGGVRLADVLGRARPRPGAVDLVLGAADGYSESIPVELASDPGVLLALAQNRRPLTQEHGFPCRLRVPPIYGMKNVKWLESIEVVRSDYEGYWQRRGWSDVATVRTQSRIDVAGREGTARRGQETWIAGVAWAGARGIERVEVSVDGGATWQEAVLRAPIGRLSWRQWALRWTPDRAGPVEVACRATDGHGVVQTEEVAPPHPAGATGYHRVGLDVL
jgi:DMSO/TMAO reductase YedYZ molybdopterin-dependent catalytic subunit